VTFFGVRGSTPCHGEDIVRYGGNTSCVSLRAPGEDPLLFDLGTGARYFGIEHGRVPGFRGNCLLSHLHWDHTQGLPFFAPVLDPTACLDLYGPVQDDGRRLGEVLGTMIDRPAFPVPLQALPGTIRCHDVGAEEFTVGGFEVMSRWVPHIGPTLGYRVTWRGRVIVYVSDHQQPVDGSLVVPPDVVELAAGADVLIHDAQYTCDEFARKPHWGHCTPDFALRVAAEAGAHSLVLFHHDPLRNDEAVDDLARCMAKQGTEVGVEVIAAAEGLSLAL
jgi:phosphoribosyl 1,2-cyclic phosphodiesterase